MKIGKSGNRESGKQEAKIGKSEKWEIGKAEKSESGGTKG
jgi:hypothetical protein